MGEESLVARLREDRFRVLDESVMSHWDMIRADCESREYLGGTHPRDMFESLVCGIEEEYHALLREAADALERAEKERDEARECAWQQGVIEFEREALDLVNLWQMKDELAVVRFREALRDARRNIEAPALSPSTKDETK